MQDRRRIRRRVTRGAAAVTTVTMLALTAAACGGDDDPAPATSTAPAATAPAATTAASALATTAAVAEFAGTKEHLLSQTAQLTDWTAQFAVLGQQYYDLAKAGELRLREAGGADQRGPEVATLLGEDQEASWVEGQPDCTSAMEGIVAGVPSTGRSTTVMILDAGSERRGGSRERRPVRA